MSDIEKLKDAYNSLAGAIEQIVANMNQNYSLINAKIDECCEQVNQLSEMHNNLVDMIVKETQKSSVNPVFLKGLTAVIVKKEVKRELKEDFVKLLKKL